MSSREVGVWAYRVGELEEVVKALLVVVEDMPCTVPRECRGVVSLAALLAHEEPAVWRARAERALEREERALEPEEQR